MASERPVGFGVVGLNWGLGRCEALRRVPEARLVAVASRREETARPAGERLGVDWYTDYREMLGRPDLDVVAIYTPNGYHHEIAIEAARAGKHVLTTKPIEISVERVDAMVEACRAAGVKLATEYMSRYDAGPYAGYRAIADGLLGRPLMGEFSFKCFRPQWYYEMGGGYRGTWAVDGGGVMVQQAVHTVDQMLWYLGQPASVSARIATFTHQIEAEDTAISVVTFESGAIATLVGTTTFLNDREPGQYGGGVVTRVEVGGDRGSVIIVDGKVEMWRSSEADHPPTATPPGINAFQDFARWVRDDAYRSPSIVLPADARRAVELVQAIYQSARTGESVALPPT
jgi:UDP-N-acetyl-2-amino-2-deoxyglucuronate dehydrogenase